MYKHLILVALAILIPGLSFVALRWPQGIYRTFSQHVAPRKSSIYFYFALFAVVLPLLCLFFAKYLVPTLDLPASALVLIIIASIAQLGCTLVPETGGVKTKVHVVLAGISALVLIGVLCYVIASRHVSYFDKQVVFWCAFLMSAIVGVVAFWKRTRLPALLLQAGYFALFFVAILAVTY